MADTQAAEPLPPARALRAAKLPPLVHPQTLQAAAALCARFGGDREALDAAALAGALLQARLLHARRDVDAAAGAEAAHALLRPPAQREPEPAAAELSEQARQAMAAAQATNRAPSPRREREPVGAGAGAFQGAAAPPLPMGAVPGALPPPMGFAPQAALLASGLGQGLAHSGAGLPHPGVWLPMAQPTVAQLSAPLGPPLVATPAGPLAAGPLAAAGPPAMPAARVPPAQQPPREVAPPLRAEAKPARPPALAGGGEEAREEAREAGERSARGPDEAEPVRCHLHRKPQMGCKICRRLHFATLDAHKKEDRDKEAALSERERLGDGDHVAGAFRRHGIEPFEVANKQTFNFNAMLRDQVLKSTYFKSLMTVETFEGVLDELYQYAESAEAYGTGTTTVPSTLFCCLFRLFTIGISYEELRQMLETRDYPYVRCCGFLYIRFGCSAEQLWEHLGDYCLDDQEFEPSKATPQFTVSMGEYVEALLMDERYYYTALPRIPVAVKKRIEEKLAPLPQYRRRTVANKNSLELFRKPGVPVEACVGSEWFPGTLVQLVETIPTRLMVRVRHEDGHEETHHLGKVILRDDRRPGAQPAPRKRSRSRSRSPRRAHSPDWTRHRGKTQEEMVQELRARQRERAVCSTGKDYARKPIGFMSGLALRRDVGVASARLREEETYAPRQVEHRRSAQEEEDARPKDSAKEREMQLRQQLVFEKYGQTNPQRAPKDAAEPGDALGEEPEVLRLG